MYKLKDWSVSDKWSFNTFSWWSAALHVNNNRHTAVSVIPFSQSHSTTTGKLV